MSAVARHTAVVKSPTYGISALVNVKGKTGPLNIKFTSLVAKSSAVTGNVQAGKAVHVRVFETDNPAGLVGTGTALVAEFTVNPGGQVNKSIVTSKFLRIETKGVAADYKGGQSLNLDFTMDGLPFHGQLDIDIHDGKTGLGFFGHTAVGGADFDNAEWPETPSAAS